MNRNQKIISSTLGIITCVFLILVCLQTKKEEIPLNVYQVYLDGEKVGLVNNQEELFQLINEEQNDIKEKYNVDSVYPPNGFEIKEFITYDEKISSAEVIYNQIKEKGDFTIKGYIITINKPIEAKEEGEEDIVEKSYIYVLDENIFKEALEKVVTAFINETDYKNYINNTQSEIADVGSYINHMYFEEDITIKVANISVKEKIFLDASALSQYLLFGTEQKTSTHIVKKGDTIESISESNKLNVNEFLIANPKFKSKNNILAIGEEVSIGLINPVLTLIQEMHVVEDVEQAYTKKTVIDSTKSSSYKQVTQIGVNGIERWTQEMKIINGEETGTIVINSITLREKVEEITTVGQSYTGGGVYIDMGGDWGWPTVQPYKIFSPFGWRGGEHHNAIDIIVQNGLNSPIYAAKAGTVVTAGRHWSYGNYIVIDHGDNIYTLYAHMNSLNASSGQQVNKGDIIGKMGSTGVSTGTHLHFSLSIGYPDQGTYKNPLILY